MKKSPRISRCAGIFLPKISAKRMDCGHLNGQDHLIVRNFGQTIEITNVYNPKFRQLCFSLRHKD